MLPVLLSVLAATAPSQEAITQLAYEGIRNQTEVAVPRCRFAPHVVLVAVRSRSLGYRRDENRPVHRRVDSPAERFYRRRIRIGPHTDV